MILISFQILFITFIVIGGDERKHHDLLIEKYRQFHPAVGTGEKLDLRIRVKALNELRNEICPYTPDLIVADLVGLRTRLPNITKGGYVKVNKSGQCTAHRVSGIFTDYDECDLDVAHVEIDWSSLIKCPHKSCKVVIAFRSQVKPRYLNKSVFVGKKGWKLTDSFNGRVGAGIKKGIIDLSGDELDIGDKKNGVRNGSEKDGVRNKYEFVLDQNTTLVAVTAVAGVSCRRILYEMLDLLPEIKFNLFNVNVSKCAHTEDGTGCLAQCEHFIVAGMTPKGLGRHAHRLCWWDFFLEKIFLIRRKPLRLCNCDSTELTIPFRGDGTFFSTGFWFEHSRYNAT